MRRTLTCPMLFVLLLIPMMARAQVMELFKLSTQPDFTGAGQTTLFVVDALPLYTRKLSVGLPKTPQQAAAVAKQRLESTSVADKKVLQWAATSQVRAAEYGIVKTPAIVFDGRAIVYGIYDTVAARRMYLTWQRAHGK